jgi:two-component system, NtrC family, sensor histidine kinase KinB
MIPCEEHTGLHTMAVEETRYEPSNRARQIAALNNISALLSVTLDPALVLESVGGALLEVTQAEGGALLLYPDDGSQVLRAVHVIGDAPPPLDGLPPILLLSETTYYDHPPFTPLNLGEDPVADSFRVHLQRHGIAAMVELPLLVGSELLGEMVAWFHHPCHFADEEIEYLRIFANLAALSINHARLHARTDRALQQRIAQISALAVINQELTATLDLQRLFEMVLDHAIDATGSKSGVLLLRPERPSDPMQIVAQRGQDKRRTAEFLQRPAVLRSLTLNQSVMEEGHSGELSVPISREGDILGVIALTGAGGDPYTSNDIAFVQQLANQALLAIDNARLFSRIEESRSSLQIILDFMHEGVLLLDAHGTVVIANPQIEKMFGIGIDYVTGKSLNYLLTEPRQRYARLLGFNSEILRQLVARVSGGEMVDIPNHTYRIDQPSPRFIERSGVVTRSYDGAVTGILLVFSDVSRQHEEAQMRESLSQMIVHDLRSPLTAVSTSLKLISEVKSPDESVNTMLHRVTDASGRALRKVLSLVDSILDIAKMEGGTMTLDRAPQSLRAIAESICEELYPIAQELEISLHLDIPDDLPPLLIDTHKIERVFLNLMDNALKFAPAEGIIRIGCKPHSEQFLRVEVADNGPGIPDDAKTQIFERFQQVSGSRGRRRGTGLGLTFCKLTVEAHGGQIWIEDNPGGGSIFVFTLPIAS